MTNKMMTSERFHEIESKSVPTNMNSKQDCINAENFCKSVSEREWEEYIHIQDMEQDCSTFDRIY